ncbi:MAG: YfiT family bacillithiol transferase [Bacteroidia bacterium]
MTDIELENLKYPVGKFVAPLAYDMDEVRHFISEIEALPALLEETIKGISTKELLFCYRPGSWNVKQIVHHLADSHLNIYPRIKLALTEDLPTIKTYDENKWADLIDANTDDLEASLNILKGVHKRLCLQARDLNEQQLHREIHHPERKVNISIYNLLAMYAWHGKHHVHQIKTALQHKF